ncbi:MAG: nitronate monooxygenase [Deltaproteobacteria bacterium]|nr:nitronate monooxygenase [Deltaproteobacteria bacterium]
MRTPLPSLKLGRRTARLPIVQGGMGVGISRWRLAGTVAREGGMGTLAAQGLGQVTDLVPRSDPRSDPHGLEALRAEIKAARELAAGQGIVAVNIMMAISHYDPLVETAVDAGVDAIVTGAGLPMDLPDKVRGDVALVPIVSSARAARTITRYWADQYGRVPEAVVVEGPRAGGHLGFTREQLTAPECQLEALVPAVAEVLREYGDIPVIAAGGIYQREDIDAALAVGARAVQLGTRFVATEECDAAEHFKRLVVASTAGDITVVRTSVGLLGRVLRTELIERFEQQQFPGFKCQYQCLKSCVAHQVHYCLADHLRDAAEGRPEGFYFVGDNAWRVREVLPVRELMRRLVEGEPPA